METTPPETELLATVRPEIIDIFVRFVRLNPRIAATDPLLVDVWKAYEEFVPPREPESENA